MTTNELYTRIEIGTCTRGQFKVTITYRNQQYTCKSNNTLAYDCLRNNDGELVYYTSEKQALLALWHECKSANNLR